MIELYYTGARASEQEQKNPSVSLGGYKSSTKVPNARLSNLFSDISLLAEQRGLTEVIGIIAKNAYTSPISAIKAWFVYPTSPFTSYEIAIVATSCECNEPYMEQLQDRFSLPYTAEFHPATETSKLSVTGTIEAGSYFGIWIKRSIIDLSSYRTPAALLTEFDSGTPPETQETVDLKIDYSV